MSANLAWISSQPWWAFVQPMISSGVYVIVHVPEIPTGEGLSFDEDDGETIGLRHGPSGGEVRVVQCSDVPVWHIQMATPFEAIASMKSVLTKEAAALLASAAMNNHIGEA
jgi:hypothetical protein